MIGGRDLGVFHLLASGIDDKPWMDDVLNRGKQIQDKAIALEREILETVNSKMET